MNQKRNGLTASDSSYEDLFKRKFSKFKPMLIRKFLSVFCLLTISSACWPADTLLVRSPSGEICVKVWMESQLKYSVSYNDKPILLPSSIDMLLEYNQDLSFNNDNRIHLAPGGGFLIRLDKL